jgi:hypothetical protein
MNTRHTPRQAMHPNLAGSKTTDAPSIPIPIPRPLS